MAHNRGDHLALFLCVGFLFSPAFFFEIQQLDDHKHIFENARMYAPSWAGLLSFWTDQYFSLYIPVTYSLWMFVSWMSLKMTGGLDPLYFHATNVFLHAVNATIVLVILRRLFPTRRLETWVGAALFGLHPLQVESVAWISGFKDVGSTLFLLLSVCFCLKIVRFRQKETFLATVLFVLAILAKPSSVMLPAFLFVLSKWRRLPVPNTTFLLWIVLALPIMAITLSIQPSHQVENAVSLWQRPPVIADTFFFYLAKTIAPFALRIDYGRIAADIATQPQSWALFVLLLGISLMGFLKRAQVATPLALFALWWISFLPVSGILPFKYQKFSTVADHYLYFSFLVLGLALCHYGPRIKCGWAIGGLILYAGLTVKQLPLWKDSRQLFTQTVKFTPQSYFGHTTLGVAYHHANDFAKAAQHFLRASQIRPDEIGIRVNYASALNMLGQNHKAKDILEEAVRSEPNTYHARFNLGLTYLHMGRVEDAKKMAQAILKRSPNHRAGLDLLKKIQASSATTS